MCRLKKKVVLITGAGTKRGLGHAMALRLAQEGADIIISDVSKAGIRHTEDDKIEKWQGLADVEAEIKALKRRVISIEADVSSEEQVKYMVRKGIDEFGKIDILVNNAGVLRAKEVSILDLEQEDWDLTLGVNLMGTYFCTKAVAKSMMQQGQGGKIINISSVVGKVPVKSWSTPYAVSKAAVLMLTQAFALELAPYNIKVNAICPGFIATEIGLGATIRSKIREGMSLEDSTSEVYSSLIPLIALKKAGQPEDISSVVAFLASDDSDYITGQTINVCGGFLMGR